MDKKTISDKAAKLVRLLAAENMTLCTAESCTGGLLSKVITDVSGASDVFKGGVCTYCNEAKVKLLGVSPETLSDYGAVSKDTAIQMSEGAVKLFGTDAGAGITGMAGPSSDDINKPVGLIYVSVTVNGKTQVIKLRNSFTEDIRTLNRYAAVDAALSLLLRQLASGKEAI